MNLLLDTHTFLWFCNEDPKLSDKARGHIEQPTNKSLISIVSLWEIAIKVSSGKLRLHEPFERLIPQILHQTGFTILDIQFQHVSTLIHLPFHHRDPFDRLLIAQALSEKIPIVSADLTFDQYDVERLW
jgi:PIN domain nuclease of toxin-antitoxin system